MPIYILIALLLGGGTSLAAEGSLPGDVLYPVKVSVNENVVAAFNLSAEAKANWQTRLAERRLEEAEELAAGGRLDAEARVKIEENFEKHTARVEARIQEFRERSDFKAAADISSNLESSLGAHEAVLLKLQASDGLEIGSIISRVRAKSSMAARVRAESEVELGSRGGDEEKNEAALGRQKSAQNKIAEVRGYLDSKRGSYSAEAVAEAEVKLRSAEDLMVEGQAKVEAKAYAEAFAIFARAHRTAQEAKLKLDAESRLKVEIGDRGESDDRRMDEDRDREERATSTVEGRGDAKVESGSGKTEAEVRVKVDVGI